MSHTTPGRTLPRLSGIPAPGARSGIPTPGSRPRSATGSNTMIAPRDSEAMNKALADAIKAHDPQRYSSELSPQLPSATYSVSSSGRRSVAGIARPPSVASTSSVSSRVPSERPRAKTPVSATAGPRTYAPRSSMPSRPESRTSNIGRSLSRAGHEFDVGDAVRIESLGMEGTLRFMGEIDGKAGIWAGVELGPAFAGKGKNDGSVAGIRYFTCAPKCGVFTLPNKLSAATSGRSIPRPSSVASHYGNGRTTPSISGRTTPSHAPAPKSIAAPLANARKKPDESTITAGSRASKYVGMTATDLGARNANTASPTRSTSTPQGTPKAPRSLPTPRARPSLPVGMTTPKPARPFNNMPPPALPMGSPRRAPRNTVTPTLSHASSETFVDDPVPGDKLNGIPNVMSVLDANDKAIQEKIALLMGPKSASADLTESTIGSPRDEGAWERIAQLERENESLRAEVASKNASIEEEAAVLNAAIERAVALEEDKRIALERVAELEKSSSGADEAEKVKAEVESAKAEADKAKTEADQAKTEAEKLKAEAEQLKADAEAKLVESESKLRDTETRVTELETQLKDAETKVSEAETKVKDADAKLVESESLVASLKSTHTDELKAKLEQITALESRVSSLDTDLQFERRELGQQVDELRLAGQETIALYEERISGMEGRRYELEDLVAELESQIENLKKGGATVVKGTTAVEIDNETLREQVSHLQRRLSAMEDQLEDARAQAEREDQAARTRITKAKEGEQAAWKECMEVKKEVEVLKREEATLKARVEELVEALREGAVTLEAARGDVEGLRAEVADLESLKATQANGEAPPVDAGETAQLKKELEEAKKALELAEKTELDLHAVVEGLEKDKTELEQLVEATTLKQTADQKLIAELQSKQLRPVGSRERLRSKPSHEQLRAESPNPRRDSVDSDSSRASKSGPGKREQITGLKHIITGLEEEIRQWGSKCAMLEQENKLLESGTEQLQVAMRRLEATIDDRLGKNANGEGEAEGSDGERIKRTETENELMKTKITEMEQKHARVVLDLNKEISELENLVESKIYREDDLERELERYKEKLARAQRNSSKLSGESTLTNGNSGKSKPAAITVVTTLESDTPENRCELCESKDHDGMDCPLLNDGHVEDSPLSSKTASAPVKDWCDDCEEFGHTVANCPNSQDVF